MMKTRVLMFALACTTCQARCEEEIEPEAIMPAEPLVPLAGLGESGQLHFSLELDPPTPHLGEFFRITTLVRHARLQEPLEHASFDLDITMPAHGHGMMTKPAHHELGEGRYLSEGLKLHMPGTWEISARVRSNGVQDSIALDYEQPLATR